MLDFKITKSFLLKASLFATGLAGIVTEYILSTLATYFIGNSVFQWTIIVSLMLFAMGLGARISRKFKSNLISTFIFIELGISLVIAFTPNIIFAFIYLQSSVAGLIYLLSIFIGLLIGTEIPIAVRINDAYEDLRVNVSSILEKDYWGALIGGALFAFLLLPYAGLHFIPAILALINFTVAILLYLGFREDVKKEKGSLWGRIALVFFFLIVNISIVKPVANFAEQSRYKDRVIYAEQTPYQKIVITQFRDDFWLYLNGNEQFSTVDEARYHETIVHLPIILNQSLVKNVLVLGGGDGLAVRELLKYKEIENIVLVDLDPAMTRLASENPTLLKINEGSLSDKRVEVVNLDAWIFLEKDTRLFDFIICDFPDSKTPELSRLYSREFYGMAFRHLRKTGILITQAGSPFFTPKAFASIFKTQAYFPGSTIPVQLNMPTLGDWGFVIHSKKQKLDIPKKTSIPIYTSFLDSSGLGRLLLFNKGEYPDTTKVEVNTLLKPVLERYYRGGNWEIW